MTEIVTDAEVIEDTPAEIVRAPVGQVSIYASTDPEAQLKEARARASVLVEIVKEQGLAKSFGSNRKPHVMVEGWSFLASQFGLIPDIEWTKEVDEGWEARAVLRRLADGAVIAHAESECRRSETKGGKQRWKNANSYEIRSMAQTRATSKVCRIALSSIMVLAGFSATPAEEMDGSASVPDAPAQPKSSDDPHCPACLVVNGEMVAVTGPHDRKPYWRCTRDGADCAGNREYNGKTYSWSGWHKTWEKSATEWLDENGHSGARDVAVEGRANHWGWVLAEIRGTLNVDKVQAKALAKTGLFATVNDGAVDFAAALDVADPPEPESLTDDQLAAIAVNLIPAEAQQVVTAACGFYDPEARAEAEAPF